MSDDLVMSDDLESVYLVIDSRSNDVVDVFASQEDALRKSLFNLHWVVDEKPLL